MLPIPHFIATLFTVVYEKKFIGNEYIAPVYGRIKHLKDSSSYL